MSDDEFLESIVSDEEVRALLSGEREPEAEHGRTGAPERDMEPGGARRSRERGAVVLATRRSGDAALLSERLTARGFRVDAVRSAFRALDLLRDRPCVAILTDSSLWAEGARLLFERIDGMEQPPLVVFLSDRVTTGGERPPKAGVAGELLCPLSPPEVEVAVEQLTAVADQEAAGGKRGSASRGPRTLERDHLRGQHSEGEAAGGGGDPRDPLLGGRSALALGQHRWELPWLRFFLEAQRRLRQDPGRDQLFDDLVRLAREVLGAAAAAIAVTTDGEVRAHVSVARVGPAHGARLTEIAELLESDSAAESVTAPVTSGIVSLDVPCVPCVPFVPFVPSVRSPPESCRDAALHRPTSENLCRVVLLGLSRPIRSVAPTFREDLRHLIAEALKRR